MGNFQESLSHGILVGIISVGRLGVAWGGVRGQHEGWGGQGRERQGAGRRRARAKGREALRFGHQESRRQDITKRQERQHAYVTYSISKATAAVFVRTWYAQSLY